MVLKFGTSGLRGLVSEMNDYTCYLYTTAFLRYVKSKNEVSKIALAGDLRPSTPRILKAIIRAVQDEGMEVIYGGLVPTPAVAFYARKLGIPSIMVTGSHIPDDRNGIKFYMTDRELLKSDEPAIVAQFDKLVRQEYKKDSFSNDMLTEEIALPDVQPAVRESYSDRIIRFFPSDCLSGLRLVVYQHSSVQRDILPAIVESLGATVIRVNRSEIFIPVDTEAVRHEDVILANKLVQEYAPFAVLSADGDGDRPLLFDETGKTVRGDVLGILCAQYLCAQTVVCPISCNTAVDSIENFERVIKSKIGSPYVIEKMVQAQEAGVARVVGYEANGGFLTQTDIEVNGQLLEALPTRDAVVPLIATLALAVQQETTVGKLLQELPQRYTYSDRLKNVPREKSMQVLDTFTGDGAAKAIEQFLELTDGMVADINYIDGVRITLTNADIIHIRPSGNAPELRCYVESSSEEQAQAVNGRTLHLLYEKLAE